MADKLKARAGRVVPAMWVVVAAYGLSAVGDLLWVTATDFETFDLGLAISELAALLGAVLLLIAGILFVMWAFAVREQLVALGAQFGRGSGQLIWWFIVPIANLFMPKRAYDELAEAAGGGPATQSVQAWWTMWVSYVAAAYVGAVVFQVATEPILVVLVSTAIAVLLGLSAVRAKNMMATLNAATELKATEIQER